MPHARTPRLAAALALSLVAFALAAPLPADGPANDLHLPWREAGLDAREAAAHLLDRMAYGARPGEIEAVVEMGLDRWMERQLAVGEAGAPPPNGEDDELARRLASARSLHLSAEELAATYPDRARLLREAAEAGVVDREEVERRRAERREQGEPGEPGEPGVSMMQMRRSVMTWAREQGYRPEREARHELLAQKVLRARYSQNQLHEVLVDFWFNHFNVSTTDRQAAVYVWPFERDAVRPHVLGDFGDMLHATARHPAMLHYLDNARSVADEGVATTVDARRDTVLARLDPRRRRMARRMERRRDADRPASDRRPTGLNENYARELLELHTLGVDGGYDQNDVEEVARAFTGWSALPPAGVPEPLRRRVEEMQRRPEMGFVFDGPFVFRADQHDAGSKVVLGHRLPAGRGIEDGLEVLDLLAVHPSTARHLCHKLAVRFVADEPPAALVERLADVFLATGGDLRAVMVALVESPELWSAAALDAKTKSPFEMAISSLRAADADVRDPRALVRRIGEMGQPLYAYQAPTGYPDRAAAWISAGALLERMRFATDLAENRIPGVRVRLDRAFGPDADAETVAAFLGGPAFQKR